MTKEQGTRNREQDTGRERFCPFCCSGLEGTEVEEEGGDGLGVFNFAGIEAGEGLVEGQGQDFDVLVLVTIGVFLAQTGGEECVELLATKAGGAVKAAQGAPGIGGIPDLFDDLAAGAGFRLFAFFKGAGR